MHRVSTVPQLGISACAWRRVGLLLAALTALLAVALTAPPANAELAPGRQLIVGFDNGTPRPEKSAIVNDTDASIARQLPGGALVVNLDAGASSGEVAAELRANEAVRYATPNHLVRASAVTDPALISNDMWGILRLHAPNAWSRSTGKGTIVAVLDGGATLTNPDLATNLWNNPREIPGNNVDDDNNGFVDDVHGADWVDRDGTPDDQGGHGTHVAGTILAAADNGFGGAGVAPDAKLMSLRFLDGRGTGTIADAVSAVQYAIDHKADVINASWGGPDYSPAMRDAFARAGAAGITVVTAAGNEGASNDQTPTYPASYNLSNLISVAASDRAGALAWFSNFGRSVDVAAPGVSILSTTGNGLSSMSGTSMASPHVAGIAALLSAFDPGLSPAQIIAAIKAGASKSDALAGKLASGGIADATGALDAVGAALPSIDRGEAPRNFKLKKPGRHVRIRGKRGWVKFSWTRSADDDLIGYDVIVGGAVRKHVKSTSARIKVPAGRYNWRVVAIDAEGNKRTASRTRASNGRIAVLSIKKKR